MLSADQLNRLWPIGWSSNSGSPLCIAQLRWCNIWMWGDTWGIDSIHRSLDSCILEARDARQAIPELMALALFLYLLHEVRR